MVDDHISDYSTSVNRTAVSELLRFKLAEFLLDGRRFAAPQKLLTSNCSLKDVKTRENKREAPMEQSLYLLLHPSSCLGE